MLRNGICIGRTSPLRLPLSDEMRVARTTALVHHRSPASSLRTGDHDRRAETTGRLQPKQLVAISRCAQERQIEHDRFPQRPPGVGYLGQGLKKRPDLSGVQREGGQAYASAVVHLGDRPGAIVFSCKKQAALANAAPQRRAFKRGPDLGPGGTKNRDRLRQRTRGHGGQPRASPKVTLDRYPRHEGLLTYPDGRTTDR
jgi:hypothetical protein